ncbi:MAG TPA: histidine kinase N-terminal 7TM domain-containing protein, partial [Candidatus Pacearchaeota archaeon]|nr:histidine kinase N-terminal 7TM domain-containing protein [Candidatus Pacearchaeota archaeon]
MQFAAISFLPLLSAILVLSLGAINFFVGKKSRINAVFTLITLAVGIWLFGTFMMFSSQNEWEAIFWDRFIYMGVVFVPALMYHFSVIFCEQKKQGIFVFLGYLFSLFFLWASRTDLFVSGVFHYRWGIHTQARFLHNVFLGEFIFFLILTLNNFYLHYRNPQLTALDRTRAKYVFLAFFILITVGSTGFLPAYNISIWPFSYLSSVVFVLILAYAIMRFRLLDIGFFMTRGLIYIMVAALLYGVTIIFYALFHSRVFGNMEIALWWVFAILSIYLFPK